MSEYTFLIQVPVGASIIMLVLIIVYTVKSFLG